MEVRCDELVAGHCVDRFPMNYLESPIRDTVTTLALSIKTPRCVRASHLLISHDQ